MENFRNLTVKQLQSKCREAGLASTGNKMVLIERLEEKAENVNTPGIRQRIGQLEKMIADLCAMSARFQPSHYSSTVSHENSPVRMSLDHVSNGNILATATSAVSENASVAANNNVQQFQPTLSQPCIPQRLPAESRPEIIIPVTTVQPNTQHIPITDYIRRPRHSYSQPFFSSGINQNNVTTASCCVTQTHPHVIPSNYHTTQPIGLPPFSSSANVYMQPPFPLPPFNQNPFSSNPYNSVREIIAILPDFDPTLNESVNSTQFVRRVETLKSAYGWDDQSLIFAVQQKMKGPAKYWVDSLQVVFSSWQQFVQKFLFDFPHEDNAADIHIRMSQLRRRLNETPQEFYFRMYALGAGGSLPESAIARHIVNGINEPNLKRKISNEYTTCNQLFRDIDSYCKYNDVITQGVKVQNKIRPVPSSERPVLTNAAVKEDHPNTTLGKVKCYNCFAYGHYSIKCPQPQRKERCSKCHRTTHRTADCNEKQKPNVNNINRKTPEPTVDLVKDVKVNGVATTAYIDSGSNYSLIRKSFAEGIGECSKCKFILKGFAGGEYSSTRKIEISLEIDGNMFKTETFLVEDDLLSENILLGRDVICRKGSRTVIEGNDCWMHNVNVVRAEEDSSETKETKLQTILQKHSASFAENISELGKCNLAKMEIQLTTDKPVYSRPYRLAFSKRNIVTNIVNDLLKNNIIRHSNSSYASGIVLVEKQDGEHRLCVDYRQLNRITKKTPYPMPIMEEHFAQLAGNNYFTTLDLRMGYHQIEIDENSKQYTAFITNEGHYEFNRMPFGLVNAPAVFQAVMNQIAKRMGSGEVLVYLDDVIIPSRTIEEGLDRLDRFLNLLRQCGLTLRRDKCNFLATEILYLGHRVSKNGITLGDSKVSAIKNFKTPTNVTEVRRFLGLTGAHLRN